MSYPLAVHALCDRLDATDVPWAVTASANLALRGLPVEPGDVDVITDADGAYDIADRFSGAVVRPVVPPSEAASEHIRSHFGALSLDGTTVELMGDVEHRIDGEWVAAPDVAAVRESVPLDGRSVPVMPLDFELTGYRARGDHDRASLVENHEDRTGVDA